jgi:mannose-6-phosphate isomerase
MGAHPGDPAELLDGSKRRLDRAISEDPASTLGAGVAQRFDGQLPFLMKVLAAAEPLSLQAHPNRAQAEAGFAAEEAAGVPLSAAARSYKDRGHKPELIVALTPFFALCGFRNVAATRRLFAALAVPELAPFLTPLAEASPTLALAHVFEQLMSAPQHLQQQIATQTLAALERTGPAAPEFGSEFEWGRRIGRLYPGDVGLVGALLLNLVRLEPFEALYLPAGNLHAYLDGAGVEFLASSDNVLSGGLTMKAVNVPELVRVLEFVELEPNPLRARDNELGEHVYPTPAAEFRLSYLKPSHPITLATSGGPEIFLVTDGDVRLGASGGELALQRGDAVFVPASEPALTLEGPGTIFRASVPAT